MRKDTLIGTAAAIVFVLTIGLVGGFESRYSRQATCTAFSHNAYTFTDESGNDWIWGKDENDNFKIGKSYKLIMDDNHTVSNIRDDRIIKIKEN